MLTSVLPGKKKKKNHCKIRHPTKEEWHVWYSNVIKENKKKGGWGWVGRNCSGLL